jgi:hypothetical protein
MLTASTSALAFEMYALVGAIMLDKKARILGERGTSDAECSLCRSAVIVETAGQEASHLAPEPDYIHMRHVMNLH